MNISNKKFKHTPIDFICQLQDYIEQLIEETDINLKSLSSFRVYLHPDDEIEYDYDSEEAYPIRLKKFKQELKKFGWYYIFCYGTKNTQKWQKATRNKKLYNRINRLIWKLLESSF